VVPAVFGMWRKITALPSIFQIIAGDACSSKLPKGATFASTRERDRAFLNDFDTKPAREAGGRRVRFTHTRQPVRDEESTMPRGASPGDAALPHARRFGALFRHKLGRRRGP